MNPPVTDELDGDWGSLLAPIDALPADEHGIPLASLTEAADAAAPDPLALLQEVLGQLDAGISDDVPAPMTGLLDEILSSDELFTVPVLDIGAASDGAAEVFHP